MSLSVELYHSLRAFIDFFDFLKFQLSFEMESEILLFCN